MPSIGSLSHQISCLFLFWDTQELETQTWGGGAGLFFCKYDFLRMLWYLGSSLWTLIFSIWGDSTCENILNLFLLQGTHLIHIVISLHWHEEPIWCFSTFCHDLWLKSCCWRQLLPWLNHECFKFDQIKILSFWKLIAENPIILDV